MTEAVFEMFSEIAYLYKIFIRIVLFVILWKIAYPMQIRRSIRWILEKRDYGKLLFLNSLFWNFHALSFLISNSGYQMIEAKLMHGYEVQSIEDMLFVYKNMAIGMVGMFLIYTICFLLMLFGIKKLELFSMMPSLKITECFFLSVLNIVGWMFAQMVGKLLVVKIETEVFILYDQPQLLWWIPLMAVLLYFGELAVLCSYQKYKEKQEEQELLFIENQQIKILKQRLEDVEGFYTNIRKVRHEMRNHMTNIKGLVSKEEYREVENYIQALDTSMQDLEYRFSTGNPVMDVVINDKWRQAKKKGILFDVDVSYSSKISVFDLAIVLNNLLDNAIEACEKISEEERYIRLVLKKKHRFVLLEVENAFDGNIKWERDSVFPMTSKFKSENIEHGIGLKNVRDVANRYLGDLDIKVTDKSFKATVLLQEEDKDENHDTND